MDWNALCSNDGDSKDAAKAPDPLWDRIEQEGDDERHAEKKQQSIDIGSASRWARVSAEDSMHFLQSSCSLSRGDWLRAMSPTERMVFEYLILIRPLSFLQRIWRLPQKSNAWKWARTGRMTGSATGSAVGHHRLNRVGKAAHDSLYKPFTGNVATEWGSGKEVYGTKCYVRNLHLLLRKVVQTPAAQQTIRDHGWFLFRGSQIPHSDAAKDPVVEVRHYGLMLDPCNHWRGISPDGVVFINGQAYGALEVKCPYAKQRALYTTIKAYYYNQLQCELYVVQQ